MQNPPATESATYPPPGKEPDAPQETPPPSQVHTNSSTDYPKGMLPPPKEKDPGLDDNRSDDNSTAIFVPLSIGLALLTLTVLYIGYRQSKRSNEDDAR